MMVEFTIQVSEDLAQRLHSIQNQLPELLQQLVAAAVTQPKASQETPSVYTEVIDFLLSQPTPEQIRLFKASPQVQAHLQTLLEKNRNQGLLEQEQAELDAYEQLEHLMILLKARAHGLPLP